MSIFTNILNSQLSNVITSVGGVIDNLTTTLDERNAAKLKATEIVEKSMNELLLIQSDIVKMEMGGNWLQRSWRPITMLVFLGLLSAYWFGLCPTLTENVTDNLFDLLRLGMGGYIIGRSVEKVAETVTTNFDLDGLKKAKK